MPEGPEVESARALVHNNLSGLRILEAHVADDEKVFVNCKDTLQSALEGRKLLEVKRKGKYLWFLLDGEGPIPLIHFGMTGSIIVQGVGSAKYTRINIDTENWPPRFCKLELAFEGGKRMAFVDGRRFGKVKLQSNPLTEEPVSKLGFDFISEMPSLEAFTEALARFQHRSSMRIKALLLDQAFAAGVGNWVADEVLYQARIHPEQPVADMEAAQIKAMHAKMLDIGQISVAANADYTEFPPDWLFHYRWTGKQASSIDGKKIDFITAGGRTSAYVPALQKLVKGSGSSSQKPASKKATPKARKAAKAESGEDTEEDAGKATKQQGSKRKATKTTAAKAEEDASHDAEQQDDEAAVEPREQNKPSGPPKGRGNKRKASEATVGTADADAAATTADDDGDAQAEDNVADNKVGGGKGRGGKQGNKRMRVSAAAPKAAGKGGRGKSGAAAAKGAEKGDAANGAEDADADRAENGDAGVDAKPEAVGAKRGRQQGKAKAAPAAAGASEKGARPKRGAAAKQK